MAKCIKGCTPNKDIILRPFPKDSEMLEIWKKKLNLAENFKPKSLDRVCSLHFNSDCFGERRLLKGAVPNAVADDNSIVEIASPIKGNRRPCAVINCVNRELNVRTHEFPKQQNLRKLWKIQCGLQNEHGKLYICESHFKSCEVGKKKLKKGVIPTRNLSKGSDEHIEPYHQQPAIRVYKKPVEVEEDITLQEFEELTRQADVYKRCAVREEEELNVPRKFICHCGWEEKCSIQQRVYQRRILYMKRKTNMLKKEIRQLKAKAIVPSNKASKEAISFAQMIVSGKQVYSEENKNIVQNIEYVSPKAYEFMRDALGFQLPSKTSLRNWRPIKCVRSGKDNNVIKHLKYMTEHMKATEKDCVLLLDEVKIDESLVYNKANDRIDGVTDFCKGQRSKDLATKAIVFMLKGIFGSWKYVLSYYATSESLRKDSLKELIMENINIAQSVGLTVVNVLMDQGSVNVGAFKALDVKVEKPYFISSNSDKIFAMYDYCHLIKSIRNTLLAHDIHTSHGVASIDVIRAVYEADTESLNIRMVHKLKYAHVYPTQRQKMKVSRAVQLLSHSVAAAIKTLDEIGYFSEDLKPKVAGTLFFVETFNKIFDVMNSKNLNDKNPDRRPYMRGNFEKTQFILNCIEYLKSFRFARQKQNKCVDGFILTLRCYLEMSQFLFIKYPHINFIMFGKFNQDALENLFFKIRSKFGCNTNPSINELQYVLARLVSMKIISFKYNLTNGNCELSSEVFIEWSRAIEESQDSSTDVNILENRLNIPIDISEADDDNEFEANVSPITQIEAQVLPYYTGYTIFAKFLKKIKCEKCIEMATAPASSASIFTIHKAFNVEKVVVSSEFYNQISSYFFRIYKDIFNNNYHLTDLRKTITTEIKRIMQTSCFYKWFDESDPCFEHRDALLDFYITVLLYKNCKNYNDKLEAERCIASNAKALEKAKSLRIGRALKDNT